MNTARLFAVALLAMVAVALGLVDYRPPHYGYRPRPRRHHEWRVDPSVFEKYQFWDLLMQHPWGYTPPICWPEPPPVSRGVWPRSCRSSPVGAACVATCDCTPDECFARDGCPMSICQEDGWGPITPAECALAIPAQPQAISCPTPIRPGLFNNSKKINEHWPHARPTEAALVAALDKALSFRAAQASASSPLRSAWDGFEDGETFIAEWSEVRVLCATESPTNDTFPPLDNPQFGQSITENGICSGRPTDPVIGIAAQDFQMGLLQNKYEERLKTAYEAYVWSYFVVPALEDVDGSAFLQGFQLMIVGNVGVDQPCEPLPVCSVTAIDFAIFTDANRAPDTVVAKRYIKLQQDKTFLWSSNETAVLNFDVEAGSAPLALLNSTAYWVRLKLVVPFNGTDGSGNARCYAYIALKDEPKYNNTPPLWQEAGGYDTNCTGVRSSIPVTDQTISMCTNGGAPGSTVLDACSAAVDSNTCGADVQRSCPFAGQDIVYSMYGFAGSPRSGHGLAAESTPSDGNPQAAGREE